MIGAEACVASVGAAFTTTVETVAVSSSGFGSFDDVTVTVLSYVVPAGSPAGIWPVSWKTLSPAGTEELLQVTVPFAPTAGAKHCQFTACIRETYVMSPGKMSDHCALKALPGPLFVTRIV